MPARRTYSGGCQCGNVTFTAELALGEVVACNCSRCRRVGHLLAYLPRDDFHLQVGDAGIREYRFHTGRIAHSFCPVCGIQTFAAGTAPDGAPSIALNVRCLDGVDVDTLPVKRCDGASY
jgi:hypothetical protein